mmetsp:Transcript_3380/g.7448  ORF Transcript_3380/g.7448 Transcript_3380/m.7448 type:complete len:372 (-) Transcript_3380:453-1568(-)
MNLIRLLTLSLAAVSRFPETLASEAEAATTIDGGDYGDDDADYDLVDMTDDELEEICTSRGFELVRETDTEYNHQHYVDAATECLQIETDLEEILEKHPEILEDVKRESDRMMNVRDRLLEELHQQQQEGTGFSIDQQHNNNTATIIDENKESETMGDSNVSDGGTQSTPTFDLKDIKPAFKSFALVAKDMGMTTYDMARRYLTAFINKGGGNDVSAAGDDEKNESSQNDQQHNATETIDEYEESETIVDSNGSDGGTQPTPDNQNELKFDLKEITIEVLEQMKSDFTKVVNFILPEKVRVQAKQHIQPALKSFALVAKDMGMTTYGVARRHLMALMNKRGGNDESAAGDENLSDENDKSSQDEESATASS